MDLKLYQEKHAAPLEYNDIVFSVWKGTWLPIKSQEPRCGRSLDLKSWNIDISIIAHSAFRKSRELPRLRAGPMAST